MLSILQQIRSAVCRQKNIFANGFGGFARTEARSFTGWAAAS
jgi:hypothetical protein